MDESILISEARQLFPRKNGRLIHIHTIRRWIAKGVKVGGQSVRLKSERVGGRIVTRPTWVAAFIEQCNRGRTEPSTVTNRSAGRLAAKRFLIAEGVYGREAQKQMPRHRMQSRGDRVRPLPKVLPQSASGDSRQPSDRAGTDRSQATEAGILPATN